MKFTLGVCVLLLWAQPIYCWGFYGHRQINYYACFLLPPGMMVFYKKHIAYLQEHAVDPDKRRYMVAQEGPRHFIDIDHYGQWPYPELPRKWSEAEKKFSADTLQQYGIVPWWIQTMLARLTKAFEEKNAAAILRNSAEIGHYIADSHVPLHACSNHNGQFTGQKGIHGFWESRVPELLAASEWDFFIGKADYISDPLAYSWKRVLESAKAADSVLSFDRLLRDSFPPDRIYSFEERNGQLIKQVSTAFSREYDKRLNYMIERRMRLSIYSVASFWYTAWVNAGQPDLSQLNGAILPPEELAEIDSLQKYWQLNKLKGKSCE